MRRFARLATWGGPTAAVLGLGAIHSSTHGYEFTGSSRFAWSLVYIAALGVASYGCGLPDIVRTRREAAVATFGAMFAAALGVSVLQLAVGNALLPRVVVFGSVAVLVPWDLLWARVAGDARSRAEGRERVLVVAARDEVDALCHELDRAPERHALVVAALTIDEARPVHPPGLPIVEIATRSRASLVVLSRAAQGDEEIVLQAARLHEAGVRVRTLSLFYEQWLGKLPIGELERVSLLFDVGELHARHYARLKRLLDTVLAIGGFVALCLATPAIWLGNRIANRGPLWYRQERVGRDGQVFRVLKFRTMHTVDPVGEPTTEGDTRVTSFGRVLRRLHLDELPQVVNVLRGDLAIVGPRPEQPHLVKELSAKLPFYRLRHLVRPGLTGWAQVKYHYGVDDLDALEKLQYEFFYLRHQSLAFDSRIVARTLRSIVGLEGR